MKLRQVHSARKLSSLLRDQHIREYNLLHSKDKKIDRQRINFTDFPSIPNQIRQPKPLIICPRKLPPNGAMASTNLNLLRARRLISSTKMPFLDLVNLLHSAISMHSSGESELRAGTCPMTSEQSYLEYVAQAPHHQFLPHPPKHKPAFFCTDSKVLSHTKFRTRPRITCHIPTVFNFPATEQEKSLETCPPSLSPSKTVHQNDEQQRPPFVLPVPDETVSLKPVASTTPSTWADPFLTAGSMESTPRLLESRGSVTVRVPTAERSQTASDIFVFAPRPPTAALHGKMPSPRVVVQKQLLYVGEIPMNAQTPRQHVPHKLVARGRFKSNPVPDNSHIPSKQHQASQVTLSLRDAPIRDGLVDHDGLVKFKSFTAFSNANLSSSGSIHTSESPFRLFNTPWKSTRDQLLG